MCELMAVAFPEARPFIEVMPWASELERLGVTGFGWGAAWLDRDGRVRGYRSSVRMAEDASGREQVAREAVSHRFLLHFRRPSKLSTVQLADSQPFVAEDGHFAFCHNGYLERHQAMRPMFARSLHGKADSEVGFRFLEQELHDGAPPGQALERTHRTLGGRANFGYLGADGDLLLYASNRINAMWRFQLGEAEVASSSLHSDDRSLFDLLFTGAQNEERFEGVQELVRHERGVTHGARG
jgi:predicted glutamine amidotransferase